MLRPQSHIFNAAVCMSTLVLLAPASDFASIAMGQISIVACIHHNALSVRRTSRMEQNLKWLNRLTLSARRRVDAAKDRSRMDHVTSTEEEDIEVGLLGWRTRLIERARAGEMAVVRGKSFNSPTNMSIARAVVSADSPGMTCDVRPQESRTGVLPPGEAGSSDNTATSQTNQYFDLSGYNREDRFAGAEQSVDGLVSSLRRALAKVKELRSWKIFGVRLSRITAILSGTHWARL